MDTLTTSADRELLELYCAHFNDRHGSLSAEAQQNLWGRNPCPIGGSSSRPRVTWAGVQTVEEVFATEPRVQEVVRKREGVLLRAYQLQRGNHLSRFVVGEAVQELGESGRLFVMDTPLFQAVGAAHTMKLTPAGEAMAQKLIEDSTLGEDAG